MEARVVTIRWSSRNAIARARGVRTQIDRPMAGWVCRCRQLKEHCVDFRGGQVKGHVHHVDGGYLSVHVSCDGTMFEPTRRNRRRASALRPYETDQLDCDICPRLECGNAGNEYSRSSDSADRMGGVLRDPGRRQVGQDRGTTGVSLKRVGGTGVPGESETNPYSAAPSALGYLAQVEYALLLVLKRLDTELEFDISIETLDDIVFHDGDNAAELLQTKHRVDRTTSLTNSSEDVWKTLHNWIVEGPSTATLTLLTNASAAEGSAMSRLRGGVGRSPAEAAAILETIARTSENKAHQPYYAAYLGLADRVAFFDRVTLVDGVPNVADLESELELAVRKSTIAAHRPALVQRLRGWWCQKVYDHLTRVASGERDRILSGEVESQLLAIAQRLRDDDLPIDFYDMPEPSDEEVDEDARAFVHQLRLIALSSARIRQCIFDHNRAFAQRSRWEREKLLHVGELKEYESRLKEEWRRYCLPDTDGIDDDDERAVQTNARDRFLRLDQSILPRIRSHVAAEYVANGSLHMLADRLEIGWHPAWLERLRQILPDLVAEVEGAA